MLRGVRYVRGVLRDWLWAVAGEMIVAGLCRPLGAGALYILHCHGHSHGHGALWECVVD